MIKLLNLLKETLSESDPKTGTGKKPKGSSRRLYTDENPNDTVSIKFKTVQDIRDTLSKSSFKSKKHARKSQIINLIHQRVRAAYTKAKDPDVKSRLKRALDYIEKRKEASKEKTERLNKLKEAITEAKQVGVIYHYTTFENGLKILQSNELKSADAADSTNANPVYAVSFTRDKRFHNNHNVGFDVSSFGQRPQVRFTVDGDKLSNKFKVQPYSQGGAFSKDRKGFEAEEQVISNKPFSISIIPYIKSVDILIEYKKPGKDDWDMEYDYETYAPLSADLIEFTQDKNIPINLIVNKNGDPWPDKAKKTIIQKILNWVGIKENLDPKTFTDKKSAIPYGSGFEPVKELVTDTEIICDNCGWKWEIVDGGDDLYMCHKCGTNNTPEQLNEKCWAGYVRKGTKTMFGKKYPNCVKK